MALGKSLSLSFLVYKAGIVILASGVVLRIQIKISAWRGTYVEGGRHSVCDAREGSASGLWPARQEFISAVSSPKLCSF